MLTFIETATRGKIPRKIKRYISNQAGIGLIEVIAALGISIIAITALVSLSLYTLRLSLQNKLELIASQQATRERELVRAVRDRSTTWAEFTNALTTAGCATSCYINASSLIPVSGSATEVVESSVNINRSLVAVIDAADSNVVRITINVSWVIAGKTRTTHLYTFLTNWRNE